jgi:phage repressor protein C with HTH and peptisase S24 domain
MIEVEGSTMYSKYNSGDIVACTIIKESNFIQWNKTHVVATQEQGIIIKRIKKGITNDCLCMVSDNLSYDPFDVPKEEITGIALVVGVIRLE